MEGQDFKWRSPTWHTSVIAVDLDIA